MKWFVESLTSLFGGILNLFPPIPVPQWAEDGTQTIGQALNKADGLGAWLPVDMALVVAGVVIAARFLGYAVKGTRIVASFFTAGGGSAA